MSRDLRVGLALCARSFLALVRLPLRALCSLEAWSDHVLREGRSERRRAVEARANNVLQFPRRSA